MIRHYLGLAARILGCVAVVAAGGATAAMGQPGRPDVQGTWEAEVGGAAFVVVIRADSSASLGDQTVRYRIRGDTLLVALGDQWFPYTLAVREGELTISGGDLLDPITLRYVGPPTPLPDSIPVPPPPPNGLRR